jgi:hypothetical protein
MTLTIQELLQISFILLKYAEKKGYNKISFLEEDSYYQKIWHEDRDLEKTPKITVGIIDDDIEALKKILDGQPPIAYDLERLGMILTTLGAVLTKN